MLLKFSAKCGSGVEENVEVAPSKLYGCRQPFYVGIFLKSS
jgi:hypothetical protein